MEEGTPASTDTPKVETVEEIISQKLTKLEDGSYGGLKEVDGKPVPIKLNEALKELGIEGDKALAVTAEVRRRKTEGSFTRVNQEKIALKAELDVYKSILPDTLDISEEKQQELDALKYSDPDKWFEEMTTIREENKSKLSQSTEEAVQKAREEAIRNDSIQNRLTQLEEFNANTATPLTDEQLENDIPPRLRKQVENGELSFKEMLVKAHEFINGTKVVGNPSHEPEPSFDGTPGANTNIKPDTRSANKVYEETKF